MAKSGRYGTAFETLEDEDEPIKKRPKRIHEEVVTDERGRRRFHGAFTGGFSAGYFNTVGSKHGWVPQTFKTSKNRRAEINQARPEDFMDEEDLGEFGFASREFHVNKKYAGNRSQPEGTAVWDRPSTVASALDDLFIISGKQTNESIGMKIMKKMGYRAGKGIGVPMTKRQLEIQRLNEERARGRRTRFDRSAIEEAEEFAKGYEFIPEDIPPVYFSCKENDHGLGYQPLKGLTGGYQSTPQVEKTKRGDAFGVGVFEDSDDDIYGNEDMSKYNFELGKVNADPMAQSSIKSDVYDTVFVPTKKPRKRPPHLTIVVPTNFNPRHTPISFDSSNLPSNIREYGRKMTVMERAMILGETNISVLNLLNFEDREKLRQARRIAEEQKKKPKKDVRKEYEAVDPFISKNVDKSNRFHKYLECLKRGVPFNKPPDLSTNEWQIEEQEFQKAVPQELRYLLPEIRERKEPLYKGDFAQTLMQKLKSKFVSKDELETKIEEKPKKNLEPFTKMEWHPSTRLCKRMNIPDPFPNSLLEGIPGALPKAKLNKEFTVTELENQLQTRGPKLVTIEDDEEVKTVVEPKEPEPLFEFFALMNEVFGTSEKEIKESEKLEETANKDSKKKEKEHEKRREEKKNEEMKRKEFTNIEKEKEKPVEKPKYRSLLDMDMEPKKELEIIEEIKKEVQNDYESDSSLGKSSKKKKKKHKHKKETKEDRKRHKKHKKKKHKKESSKKWKKIRQRSNSSEFSSSSVIDVY